MANDFFPETLETTRRGMAELGKGIPAVMERFGSLHKAVASPSALDTKVKELMALAIAVAARCDGCIAFHTEAALAGGATKDEITETLGVAVLMGGGPSVMYAVRVLQAVKEFQAADP